MLALAQSGAAGDRGRLLIAIAQLCNSTEECSRPEIQALLDDIFMDLVGRAEREVRLRLAETLALTAWSPHAVILSLVNDEIEIARPIIAQSPVLTDQDLIRLLRDAPVEHQIEVARRPKLTAEVAAAVVDKAEADVLAALAGNVTAQVSLLNLTRMVHCSRRMAVLRAPLARHPGLTGELAGLLYSWVGEALRSVLTERFPSQKAALERAVVVAVQDAAACADEGDGRDGADLIEKRLVDKLLAADQLRAGLLIRALHEGKLTLFKSGLAALAKLSSKEIGLAVAADRPDMLANACSSAGIDRSAFPTVLRLVRNLNGGRPGGSDADERSDMQEDVSQQSQHRV